MKNYTEDRILYPMKRVDFDYKGDRHPENRGKSGYERISWEEALEIVTSEMKRIRDQYGASAIGALDQDHHNWGIVGYRFGPYFGSLTPSVLPKYCIIPIAGGLALGAPHAYGFYWRLGMSEQFDMVEETLKYSDMVVYWSIDPDSIRPVIAGPNALSGING
jgi:trimethylamine-N-oxide reductase (cytochrome c)